MDNQNPPWAAYRAFVSGHLISLDKLLGMCPVGVGGTWRRFFSRCVLKVTGYEATHVWKDEWLFSRLKPGIKRAAQRVQYIWGANSTEENYVYPLVDANNSFNQINWIGMLWTVRHLWPFGARFVFNCYCNHSSLVLINWDVTSNIIHSREGVTHGDPLAMIIYAIGIHTLTKRIKST